jgi:hypothetical protein
MKAQGLDTMRVPAHHRRKSIVLLLLMAVVGSLAVCHPRWCYWRGPHWPGAHRVAPVDQERDGDHGKARAESSRALSFSDFPL